MPGLLFQPLLRHGNHAMRQSPVKGQVIVQQDMEWLVFDSVEVESVQLQFIWNSLLIVYDVDSACTYQCADVGHDGNSLDICSRSSKFQQLRHAAAQQAVLEGSLVLDPPVTVSAEEKKNSSASG
jgi:hypothetical protein